MISANSRSLGDGECDVACNTESCGYDHGDCFRGHDECYNRADGADYRGTVRIDLRNYHDLIMK